MAEQQSVPFDPQAGIPRNCCACESPYDLVWVVYARVSRIVGHPSGDWYCRECFNARTWFQETPE